MAIPYLSNHYVPQWYQRRFFASDSEDRELYRLDLKPDWFLDGKGIKRQRKALKKTGTRKCFAQDDLYTTSFRGVESRELERVFFGQVDTRGKKAVEFFATYNHTGLEETALQDLMLYMSTQKLRTPKGLDWLAAQAGTSERRHALAYVQRLRTVYGAIWAESVWQLVDASGSATKFIVSDHPVAVYNRALPPTSLHWCQGPWDPDIRLHGTHTLFALSPERMLILTNQLWAASPQRSPIEARPNPDLHRSAIFNFLDIHTGRLLTEQEVREINFILKSRSYRYIAAGKEEWLYPERHVTAGWRGLGGGCLLMPDPRSVIPGSEMILAYSDGATFSLDSSGREPWEDSFGAEGRSGPETQAHSRWCEEFARRYPDLRGASWEHAPHRD